MKAKRVLLILAIVLGAGVLGFVAVRSEDGGRRAKVGVTDCEITGKGVRGEDYEYINESSGITNECKPLRIFNEEVVHEKYRYLLSEEVR